MPTRKKTLKKILRKNLKVLRGGGKESKKKPNSYKKKSVGKLTKPEPEPIINGLYFNAQQDNLYNIIEHCGDKCIYIMENPHLTVEVNKLSQEVNEEIKEELSKCGLGEVVIKTEINYRKYKSNEYGPPSIYTPILLAIYKYLYSKFQDKLEVIPILPGTTLSGIISIFKKIKVKVDAEAIKLAKEAASSTSGADDLASRDASFLASCIGNIVDFFSIISPSSKTSGKIYFFTMGAVSSAAAEMNKASEKWGIICIKNNTSIMGTEFRRDESFNLERDTIGFNIQPLKTYIIYKQHKQAAILSSIVIRLCLIIDKLHDLKGRNTPNERGKMIQKLYIIINRLYEKFDKIIVEEFDPVMICFYEFTKNVFYMFNEHKGSSILNTIEDSFLYLFLCLTNSLKNDITLDNIKLNIGDPKELSPVTHIIDNAMGRETEINKRFKNVNRVISASTLFDGGCKLSKEKKRYSLLEEEEGKGKIYPYTIKYGDWEFSRKLFYSMTDEDKKINKNGSGLFVSVNTESNKVTTSIHFFLDRKYSAASIASDELKVNFSGGDNIYEPNKDLFDSRKKPTDPSFIDIKNGVLTHEIKEVFNDEPHPIEHNFYNTKALCDVGQCCELFGFEANNYATVHNDRSAAIFQIINQFLLYFGGVGYYPPTASSLSAASPSVSSVSSSVSSSAAASSESSLASSSAAASVETGKAYLCKVSLDTVNKKINSEGLTISCNKDIVDTEGLLTWRAQQGSGHCYSIKENIEDSKSIKENIKELYSIYSHLFDFDEYTSSEFFYRLRGYYSKNIMEEDLCNRSLVHYILKSQSLEELYEFLSILNGEDKKEFKFFVNYNTKLIHKTCCELQLDLEYPGTEWIIKDLDLKELLLKIKSLLDSTEQAPAAAAEAEAAATEAAADQSGTSTPLPRGVFRSHKRQRNKRKTNNRQTNNSQTNKSQTNKNNTRKRKFLSQNVKK